MIDVIT